MLFNLIQMMQLFMLIKVEYITFDFLGISLFYIGKYD